jgi:hypothetical protein
MYSLADQFSQVDLSQPGPKRLNNFAKSACHSAIAQSQRELPAELYTAGQTARILA